jgi:hypothetical protein
MTPEQAELFGLGKVTRFGKGAIVGGRRIGVGQQRRGAVWLG